MSPYTIMGLTVPLSYEQDILMGALDIGPLLRNNTTHPPLFGYITYKLGMGWISLVEYMVLYHGYLQERLNRDKHSYSWVRFGFGAGSFGFRDCPRT